MRAAVIHRFEAPLAIDEVPDPVCPADGVVLRVLACGVCRSDHHAWQGHDPDVVLPQIPGHELCGEVLATGPGVRAWRRGDRVIAPFVLGCGHCAACDSGEATVCADQILPGFSAPGAFAQFVAIPHADFNLARLPQGLSPVAGAALGCRVTTAFRALVDRARVQPGEWVAVFGCGGVGLSCIQLARALDARPIGIDIATDKLGLARRLGAEHTIDASAIDDCASAVAELTHGGAQVAVEALGRTETFHNSLMSLAPLGRLVQIGMPTGVHTRPALALERLYSRQLTLHGTRGMPSHRFAALFELLERSDIDLEAMVARRITLDGVNEALERFTQYRGAGISIIDFSL